MKTEIYNCWSSVLCSLHAAQGTGVPGANNMKKKGCVLSLDLEPGGAYHLPWHVTSGIPAGCTPMSLGTMRRMSLVRILIFSESAGWWGMSKL